MARVARQDAGARDDAETEALKIAESAEIAEIADRHEEEMKEALQTIDAKSNGTLQGVMDPGKDEGDDDVAAKSTDTLQTLLATAAASDVVQKSLKIADVEAEEAEEEEEELENEAEDDVDEVYTPMKPQKSKKRRLQTKTSEADLADPVKNGTVGEDFADASDPLAVFFCLSMRRLRFVLQRICKLPVSHWGDGLLQVHKTLTFGRWGVFAAAAAKNNTDRIRPV